MALAQEIGRVLPRVPPHIGDHARARRRPALECHTRRAMIFSDIATRARGGAASVRST